MKLHKFFVLTVLLVLLGSLAACSDEHVDPPSPIAPTPVAPTPVATTTATTTITLIVSPPIITAGPPPVVATSTVLGFSLPVTKVAEYHGTTLVAVIDGDIVIFPTVGNPKNLTNGRGIKIGHPKISPGLDKVVFEEHGRCTSTSIIKEVDIASLAISLVVGSENCSDTLSFRYPAYGPDGDIWFSVVNVALGSNEYIGYIKNGVIVKYSLAGGSVEGQVFPTPDGLVGVSSGTSSPITLNLFRYIFKGSVSQKMYKGNFWAFDPSVNSLNTIVAASAVNGNDEGRNIIFVDIKTGVVTKVSSSRNGIYDVEPSFLNDGISVVYKATDVHFNPAVVRFYVKTAGNEEIEIGGLQGATYLGASR